MKLGARVVQTVPVACAVCNRRLQGHPTSNGFYAVGRHTNTETGRPCRGFFRYALPVNVRPVDTDGEIGSRNAQRLPADIGSVNAEHVTHISKGRVSL